MNNPAAHPLAPVVATFIGLLAVGLTVRNIVCDRIEGWWERRAAEVTANINVWGEG